MTMRIVIEDIPYKKKMRYEYFMNMARKLGVDEDFVKQLFRREKQKIVGERFDIGGYIKRKAKSKDRPKTRVRKSTVCVKPVDNILTGKRKIQCVSGVSPRCLGVFITTSEDECIRCKIHKNRQ